MKINTILQAFKIQTIIRNSRRIAPDSPASVSTKDTVQISSEAKALQKTQAEFAIGKEALAKVSSVREDKIASVMNRINSGYYDSPEFRAQISDTILKELVTIQPGSKPAAASMEVSKFSGEIREIRREEKVSEIQNRIKGNYYNDPQVKDAIAENLLRQFGL